MSLLLRLGVVWFVIGMLPAMVVAAELPVVVGLKHLRNAEPREWNEFPEQAAGREWTAEFELSEKFRPQTLRVRHRDLKQLWRIRIDEHEIARLPRDENAMVTFWPLPTDKLAPGKHTLKISSTDKAADDIWIGDVTLDDRPQAEVLAEGKIDITVVDQAGQPIPARITIVDEHGSLMTTSAVSNDTLAVRPGVLYTATGRAPFGVPRGRYTIYAGRGFEYSLAQAQVQITAGDVKEVRLSLTREVDTAGWVACDTHVHTLTYSGHGDSTIQERMITLAGEGIELPIATDHNVQINHAPFAEQLGVRRFFTPVIGNEVTTKVGHFNVFPLTADMPVLDHRGTDWQQVGDALQAAGPERIVILNHARDLHSGFRPFGPTRHIAMAGEDREGWSLPANAMEVVNSGATQNDPWQLFNDWLGLLNRGLAITPIGSSDSHDVSKHFVGQGRTYIQVDDRDPSEIDVAAACRSLRAGRVMSGSGLICKATINGQAGPGDLAPKSDEYQIAVEACGPRWVPTPEVRLYVNGVAVTAKPQTTGSSALPRGVRWRGTWHLTGLKHDAHVVAVAVGAGVKGLYWPSAKPYQPTSPDASTHCVGCCGAIRIDGDGDGSYRSPNAYAAEMLSRIGNDETKLVTGLAKFDESVAVQIASLLRAQDAERYAALVKLAAGDVPPQIKRGVLDYHAAWRAGLPGNASQSSSLR
ncbi:MAG: CehA/McbA family metallohydrolase [Planctomycetaceae bacterium]|nr:CehA/McbA family metallohydrolase [Planctomycetaceae bacterium]